MGIAAGYHLATGKVAVVYIQNSGEGNIINPLASLTDKEVYNIPVLLVIGWRGHPGVYDEPQHIKQGKVTIGLLNTMGINYAILSKEEEDAAKQIKIAADFMKVTNECYALVIEKDTFDTYKLRDVEMNDLTMSREEAIRKVASNIEDNACIVSTTGMISRELLRHVPHGTKVTNAIFSLWVLWGTLRRLLLVSHSRSLSVEYIALMAMVPVLCIWAIWLLSPA